MLTTGQIARSAALSEKAVRLYVERGLLSSHRDAANHRIFADDQADRARRIMLLRTLDFSLAEVAAVLDAPDPAAVYDYVWEARRAENARAEGASEYVRGVLRGDPVLPGGLEVRRRLEQSRSVLRVRAEATLTEVASVLPHLSERLFCALRAADAPLAGFLYVEFCSRATEAYPAEIRVCAPFEGAIRPPEGMEITLDPGHGEHYVGLDQAQADDQRLVVAVHDYLSACVGGLRSGPNREIYRPEFATGAPGVVMEIAVAVES